MKVKNILGLMAILLFAAVTNADVPKWIKKLPKAGNNTYRYVMESASGANIEDARNQAFSRILYTTANKFGMPFSSSSLNSNKTPEALATEYNIPINKVCEYRKKIPGGVEVYILCQVAVSATIRVIFDEYRDCGSAQSDDIQFEVDFPTDWKIYGSDNYISSFERDINRDNTSETGFKDYLANIAKQKIIDRMNIEGDESSFINVKTDYSQQRKEGFVVAYVERRTACEYFSKRIEQLFTTATNNILRAETFLSVNNNSKAKEELIKTKSIIETIDKHLFKRISYGCKESPSQQETRDQLETIVSFKLDSLQNLGGTNIYISSQADLFGRNYTGLTHSIKTKLSNQDYVFSDDKDNADYTININANCRKHPSPNAIFTYVDANITITNNKTHKTIYDGSVTEKGGSTFTHEDAGEQAYKTISGKIATEVINKIK